jgi:hypothetical protein
MNDPRHKQVAGRNVTRGNLTNCLDSMKIEEDMQCIKRNAYCMVDRNNTCEISLSNLDAPLAKIECNIEANTRQLPG